MASATHNIMFSIAAEMSAGFAKSFYKAKSAITTFQDDWRKTNKALKDVDGVIGLRNDVEKQYDTINKSKNLLAYYRAEAKKNTHQKQYFRDKVKETVIEIRRENAELKKQAEKLKKLEHASGLAGKGLDALMIKQRKLRKEADKFALRQSWRDLGESINSKRQAYLAGLGEGVGALSTVRTVSSQAFGAPVQSAMSVEDTMAEIKKVADDETLKQIGEFQKELRDMTMRIPRTFQELGSIAAAAAQSGIAGKDNLLQFTEKASQMSVAFDMAADSAGDMMAKWKSGLNLDLGKVYELADIVNTMSNQNAALAKQIGGVIMRSGAFAASAGLGEKELVALAGSLIGSGATEETAATGIEAIMREATKGALMNERQMAAFLHASGLSPSDLQKEMQRDATGTLLKVLEGVQKKIKPEMQTMYLTAMFGDVGSKALAPLLKNIGMLKKNIELATNPANSVNSMLKEFEARAATTSNAFVLMGNSIEAVKAIIGGQLLGPVREATLGFVNYAKTAADFIEANKEIILPAAKALGSIMGLAAGLATARIAANLAMYAFGPVVSVFTWLIKNRAAFGAAMAAMSAGMKGFGIALRFMFLNPIGLAITAISALIAGAMWLYKKWGSIKKTQAVIKPEVEKAMQAATTLEVPEMANGGIVTGPTLALVGEGRESEAVLPLSKLGGMLGSRSANSNVVVNLSVNVSGSSQDAYADVKRGISEGSANLKRELERLLNNQRRLSFT